MENNILSDSWFSAEWFLPSTFASYTWERNWILWCLLGILILFVVRWFMRYRFNQKLPVALQQKDVHSTKWAWVRLIPEFIFMLMLALLVIALARPQRTNEKVEQFTEGIDIMLALDVSKSMEISDFEPNRLEVAKTVARQFVMERKQDRIGIVVFSGDAFSLAPLTTDYDLLKKYFEEINFDMIDNKGTAIGSALGVVINRMSESKAKSKVCILLSDGDSNAGNIDPITAAELADAYGIKVYTIIVGREGMVPFKTDFFGRPNMVENTVNETTMRKIAEIAKGMFFRVQDEEALQKVFNQINEFEKAEIKETRYKDTSDYYFHYLRWALVLMLIWLALKSTFMSNILQD
ncbi:MAG: VWA domain-containing protein [Cyclobacteriaceae bacterium]|jgi:Ca-activated chloride channel family protein|nr:VWA domain-containing protein [Flammeovirgaceae bacterium]MCZ8022316.1 VWA domain-containing protein [Cytophagales bacterium]MCZ8326621.1 VWA domain-containing protein [Cyclobacteriaceae bacterium]